MSKITFKNENTTRHDFGIKDNKGREMGALVLTFNVDEIYDSRHFGVRVQAAKDGKSWGATQMRKYFQTPEDRQKYIDKRIAGMKKRAAK